MRILEDMSRKTNIPVECIPGSENEGWYVMKVKLRKVITDELDIGIVVIEWVHRVKIMMIKIINDQNRNLPRVVARSLHFKDK